MFGVFAEGSFRCLRGPLGTPWGPSWDPLGVLLQLSGALLRAPWDSLGALFGDLGPSSPHDGFLEPYEKPLGPVVGPY